MKVRNALVVVLCVAVSLVVLSSRVCAGEAAGHGVSMKVVAPAKVLSGDPIKVHVTLQNDSDRDVECARPDSSSVQVVGLALVLTRKEPLARKHYGDIELIRAQTLKPGGKWEVDISVRREFAFPEKDAGQYELEIRHGAAGSWQGQFEVAAPSDYQQRVLEFETTPLESAPAGKKDIHRILLRKHNARCELLYWNSGVACDGNQRIDAVPADTTVKAIVLEKHLTTPMCYTPTGGVRKVDPKELQAAREKRIAKETPYLEALDIALKTRVSDRAMAVLLAWANDGKLHVFSAGKYLPLPLLPQAHGEIPAGVMELGRRLLSYDVLCPAKIVELESPITAVESVEVLHSAAKILCVPAGKEQGRVQVVVDYSGRKVSEIGLDK